jgi:hypothetical protein
MYSTIWNYLELLGTIWNYWVLFGTIRNYLELLGTIGNYLELLVMYSTIGYYWELYCAITHSTSNLRYLGSQYQAISISSMEYNYNIARTALQGKNSLDHDRLPC